MLKYCIIFFRTHIFLCLLSFFYYAESDILRLYECGKLRGTFSVVIPNKSLAGSIITYYTGIPRKKCLIYCILHIKCQSTNFIAEDRQANGLCELNRKNSSGNLSMLVERNGSLYSETPTNQTKVIYK